VTEKFERLVAAGIQLMPLTGITTHFVFQRDGFAVLVERKGDAVGQIGSAGLLCEKGLAVLVWRGNDPYFVTKGFEQLAAPGQVDGLRRFAADLEQALR
jgi:hypothetical protein